MSLPSRLRRHLSYANVIASVALFAALGGSAYAASKINGGNIVNQSIAGKKLKNGTITNKQIKKGTITSAQIQAGSLNSTVINVSTLGTVPSAQSAVTATSAETATKATTATSATSAQTAAEATSAGTAKTATEADHAATAGDAETLNGKSAEELTLSCPDETELYGGMCWDEDPRASRNWIQAAKDCGDEGGRLPSLSELIAFLAQPGPQVAAHNWSSDVADLETGVEIVFTSDEAGRAKALGSASFAYRCLFYRSN
ncbi:MAG TPA: hypothetical protein VLL27_01460 [Solirubrobacterales bacterium]|nr:hypothetical protein [Solirubrobacterales bacterium]